MGLSENEQRILEELETQLRSEDPALARRASKFANGSLGTRSMLQPIILFVVGFGLLLLLTFSALFAIAGAALMLVGLVQGAQTLSALAREQVNQAKQKASQNDEG